MNVCKAVQDYISKAVAAVPGMKVMLMDRYTIGIVSMAFSQTTMNHKEVYLFERIDVKGRETLIQLNAVCLLRATDENVLLLVDELKQPKYASYSIFFTTPLRENQLNALAAADSSSLVQHLQEYFVDFYPINDDTFSLNEEGLFHSNQPQWRQNMCRRVSQGVVACLLSLRKRPAIRYQGQSVLCVDLANELAKSIDREPLFAQAGGQAGESLLLLLDRRDDPVTPLLSQWHYQAMIHEMLGIRNNRVDLSEYPDVPKDLCDVVLSPEQDSWYRENRYANFGDFCTTVPALVNEYKRKKEELHRTLDPKNMQSCTVAEIRKVVQDLPEFRKQGVHVLKHASLVHELQRQVAARDLFFISEAEQQLANKHDLSNAKLAMQQVLDKKEVSAADKRRVHLLFCLRYEEYANTFVESLLNLELPSLVSEVLTYAGSSVRAADSPYGPKSTLAAARKAVKRGLSEAPTSIYTVHKPFLLDTLSELLRNRLPETTHPFLGAPPAAPSRAPPRDVIVFMIGGITYEEALTIYQLNQQQTQCRFVLGGTSVHNSKSFLESVVNLVHETK